MILTSAYEFPSFPNWELNFTPESNRCLDKVQVFNNFYSFGLDKVYFEFGMNTSILTEIHLK